MNYCPHCGCKLNNNYTICPSCKQRLRFASDSTDSEIVKCAKCSGRGEIDTGFWARGWVTCDACNGSGVQRV